MFGTFLSFHPLKAGSPWMFCNIDTNDVLTDNPERFIEKVACSPKTRYFLLKVKLKLTLTT